MPALIAIVLIVCLAAGGGATALYLRGVQSDLGAKFARGQTDLETGRSLLKQANAEHKPELVGLATAKFQAAHAEFAAVDNTPILKAAGPANSLSWVSKRTAAVHHLALMGESLSDSGAAAARVDALLLAPTPDAEKGQGTKRLLGRLHQARPDIAKAGKDLQKAQREAAAVDVTVLPGAQQKAFVSARSSIDKGLADLQEFDRLSPMLDEVLGMNGPRTYLVEQVNQTELRPGGGYIGTFSLLNADQGTLKILRSGDTHLLPDFSINQGQKGYVPPPATMLEFLGKHSWSLQDSNFFPDFPSSAKAAEQFAQQDFGQPVDGVISIDLTAISSLLQVTGPMNVPDLGTVDNTTLIDKAVKIDVSGDPNHKSALFQLTTPLMDRLTNLNSSQWPQLLATLNQAAAQRHLQTYFNKDTVQTEMQRFAWSGELQAAPSTDYMYPLETNFGGNKTNYWLTRTYSLTLTRAGTVLHHELQVDLVLDRHTFVSQYNQFYRCYFRLYTSGSASNLKITNVKGDNYPNTSVPSGLKLVDGWQQINPNLRTQTGELKVTYTWDTPWTPDASGAQSVYWQKEAGTNTDKATINWIDGASHVTLNTDLSVDRLIKLTRGHATVQPGLTPAAKLPSVSL